MAAGGRTRFAHSGEISLAYQVLGDGPLDLVFVPGFVSHLEVAYELPNITGVFDRLSSFSRVIVFDKRGTGMSDRSLGLPTLAERMDDIGAVMNAAGCERAAIVGPSESGAAAMMFAASYPERVSALVLWITAAAPPLSAQDENLKQTVNVLVDHMGEHWGDGSATRFLIGAGAPLDPAVDEAFARYERYSATPSAAQAVIRRNFEVDSRPFLSSICVPTLLIAHKGDPVIPIERARETAAGIRGSKLVETDGASHWSWDIADLSDLDVIENFLTGSNKSESTAQSIRKLVTILVTDIVGSTEQAFRLGDKRWIKLLDQHDAAVGDEVRRNGGRELHPTGDGFVTAFDGPARAVNCAHAIVRRARVLGLEVRAGLHTGECEVRSHDLAGVTIHVAARVCAKADAGEVLVSRVVHDLVAGSAYEFDSRGYYELKGVPDKVELLNSTIGSEI